MAGGAAKRSWPARRAAAAGPLCASAGQGSLGSKPRAAVRLLMCFNSFQAYPKGRLKAPTALMRVCVSKFAQFVPGTLSLLLLRGDSLDLTPAWLARRRLRLNAAAGAVRTRATRGTLQRGRAAHASRARRRADAGGAALRGGGLRGPRGEAQRRRSRRRSAPRPLSALSLAVPPNRSLARPYSPP